MRFVLITLCVVGARASAGIDLLVSARLSNNVVGFDASGAPEGVFASGNGLSGPNGMAIGSDGNLYVGSASNEVLRFDGSTGAFIDVFAAAPDLNGPRDLLFGPDGNLYVASGMNDRVLRFAPDGTFIDTFAMSAELDGPVGLAFGPGGDLFVASAINSRVLRYDATGAFGEIVASGLLVGAPTDVTFGPDGRLYFGSNQRSQVMVIDLDSGSVNPFAAGGLVTPIGLAFEGDSLFVASFGNDTVQRFDAASGAYLDEHIAPGAGGMDGPGFVLFVPGPGTITAVSFAALLARRRRFV